MSSGNRRVIVTLCLLGGVGLFCLFLLAALIVPWLNQKREDARRSVCLNNSRNLGLSIASYETSHRIYPGYRDGLKIEQSIEIGGVATNKVPVHWVVSLLPNLERPDLASKWKNVTGVDITPEGQVTYTFPKGDATSGSPLDYLDLLVCPSDARNLQAAGQGRPISYVVNSGLQDVAATAEYPADWIYNGVFISRWEMPQAADAKPLLIAQSNADTVSRGDGASSTLLLSESAGARNYDDVFLNADGSGSLQTPVSEQWSSFVWQPQYPLPAGLSQAKINGRSASGPDYSRSLAPDITYARPSSNHPGGANFVYCDTHSKFINENIDYLVFSLLMTSNGVEARMPGTREPVPPVFTTIPLDETQIF